MRSLWSISPFNTLLATLIASLALLTACGGLGSGPEPETRSDTLLDRVAGVVNRVDTLNQVIDMTTDRDSQVVPGRRIDINYDELTTVEFEGNVFRPADLEPGDRIVAEVEDVGASLAVRSIIVTDDASPGGVVGRTTDDQHIVGTLRALDTRASTITVDTDNYSLDQVVGFDSRTRVFYGSRAIEITELRERDELEIELVSGVRDPLANTIRVVDSGYTPNAGGNTGSDAATARGEVVLVDENRLELVIDTDESFPSVLDSTRSYDPRSSFDTRSGRRTTFRYEPGVIVEYQGDYYAPSNLEQGDGVEISYERTGDMLWAKRILVIYNSRS